MNFDLAFESTYQLYGSPGFDKYKLQRFIKYLIKLGDFTFVTLAKELKEDPTELCSWCNQHYTNKGIFNTIMAKWVEDKRIALRLADLERDESLFSIVVKTVRQDNGATDWITVPRQGATVQNVAEGMIGKQVDAYDQIIEIRFKNKSVDWSTKLDELNIDYDKDFFTLIHIESCRCVIM